jgi:DNA-binding response OmpR family regulator
MTIRNREVGALTHAKKEQTPVLTLVPDEGTILVVEDEPITRAMIVKTLTRASYQVQVATTGEEALAWLTSRAADLVVLDVKLPGMDGFEVCRQLRAGQNPVAVIMVTVLGSVEDRVRGLALGADDYLVKPFHAEELTARVMAVLRRTRKSAGLGGQLTFRNLRVEFQSHKGFKDGEDLALTPKEFLLLAEFCGQPGRALSRAELSARVWGENHQVSAKSLDVYIGRLRQKVEDDPGEPSLIHTVRGYGYICE